MSSEKDFPKRSGSKEHGLGRGAFNRGVPANGGIPQRMNDITPGGKPGFVDKPPTPPRGGETLKGEAGGEDNIQSQRQLLDVIHLDQIDTFQRTGILGKVRSVIGATDDQLIGQPMASVVKKNTDGTDVITQYAIALARTEVNQYGYEQTSIQHIPVAQEFGGSIMPLGDFTQDDAEIVFQMVQRLKELKGEGILPNLELNYMNISDPRTGIAVYRPSKTEKDSLHTSAEVTHGKNNPRRLSIRFFGGGGTTKDLIDAGYIKNGKPALGFYVDPDIPEKVFRYAFHGSKNTEQSRRSAQESVDNMKADYTRLHSHEINVPDFDPQLCEEVPTGYVLLLTGVDIVHGQNLIEYLQKNELTPELRGQMEDVFENQIKYVRETITGGHRYLSDTLVLQQYMIGNTAKDPDNKLYMVDVAPEGRDLSGEGVYKAGLMQIAASIKISETISGKRFDHTRKLLTSEIEDMHAFLSLRLREYDTEKRQFMESTHRQIFEYLNMPPLSY